MILEQARGPDQEERTVTYLQHVHQILRWPEQWGVTEQDMQDLPDSDDDQEVVDRLCWEGSYADDLAAKQWEYTAWLQQGLLQIINQCLSSLQN
jgi:hypothetical protein